MNSKISVFLKKLCFIAAIVFTVKMFIIALICIIPNKTLTKYEQTKYSIKYYDRNGKLLRWSPSADGSWQTKISPDQIPQPLIETIILAEDRRFYLHNGVDLLSVCRSIWQNVTTGCIISGASTVSMQLARMIYPHKKSFKYKMVEALQAMYLECKKGKKWILEQYINNIPFGYNTKGYAAAAEIYFNKTLLDLDRIDMAILAVIPRGPTKYNPYNKPDNVINAARSIINRISYGRTDSTDKIRLAVDSLSRGKKTFICPHFVNYVSDYIEKYCEPGIFKQADGINTTIDIDIQDQAQKIAEGELVKYRNNRLNNISVLILNKDNEIVSYIGNPDFYDEENSGQIDGIQTPNQPGSTLKPFLYALAFDNGFGANMILPDIPMSFGGEQNYRPGNYNLRTNGPVRMRIALGSSLNIPAVYLINRLGVNNFISHLQGLDFYSLDNITSYPGAGLALGNAPVTLFELTRAFSVFSHGGLLRQTKPVKRLIIGSKTEDFEPSVHIRDDKLSTMLDKQIYSETASFLTYDILSDEKARTLGFKRNNFFNGRKIAAKTGTSNQFGNIWAVAAWSEYTIGVWAGNFNGNTVQGVPGAGLPLTIVKKLVDLLYSDDCPQIPCPANLELRTICSLSGGEPTSKCDTRVLEYFDKNRPSHNPPCEYHKTASNGAGYISYPAEYVKWASAHNLLSPYQKFDAGDMSFEIVSPINNNIYYIDPYIAPSSQAVSLNVSYKQSGKNLYYTINDGPRRILSYPYHTRIELRLGTNVITVSNDDGSLTKTVSYTVK